MSTDAPITVNMSRFEDDGRVVVHLINTDYDQVTDAFTDPGDFSMMVNARGKVIASVKLYDFEQASITSLDFTQEGDQVTFNVPGVFAYSIVELSE